MDALTRYQLLGRLIEEMPQFEYDKPLTDDNHKWIGRVDALLAGPGVNQIEWRGAVVMGGIYQDNSVQKMKAILFRALAAAEGAAPPAARGSFIPVGNAFDAFSALAKLLSGAAHDVLIIDPYMDESALTEFGTVTTEGVQMRLLFDSQNPSQALIAASKKWTAQYGSKRPLQVRQSPNRALHDRALIVDGKTAWTLTQSLKDFAKRSPAEIVSAGDIAALKIPAYESVWAQSTVIV
jgi:hypothetical protein